MKILYKILIPAIALTVLVNICKAQESAILPDSTYLTLKNSSVDQEEKIQEQNRKKVQDENAAQQRVNSQNKTSGKPVKQVKSARPDFSKSKGARPNIKRPSGSGIPKGVGKPGGAGRKGGS